MNSNEEIYQTSYLPYINKWGKITSWLCIVIVYIPTMVLIGIYGAQLPFDATINGIIAILSASFAMYIADPLAVFPVLGTPGLYLTLGTPGLYLTYLSGNSKSIRVPASLMAQDAAGTEQGTPEGNIMSCIGVAISVLISTLVMTVMIFMGKWIIAVLPEKVVEALPMLMPALFGALLGQQFLQRPKLACAAIVLAIVVRIAQVNGIFQILPLGGGYAPMLLCVFGTIAIARGMIKKSWIEK